MTLSAPTSDADEDVAAVRPSPGADVGGVRPVPVHMWAGVSAAPVQMWARWAHGLRASVTINGPRSEPPMPMLTMSVIFSPVWPITYTVL